MSAAVARGLAVVALCGLCTCAHTLRGANPDVPVSLPEDHAAHGDAQSEWWHFHGHVTDAEGRRYDWFLAFVKQHTDLDSVLLLPVRWFVDPFEVAYFTVTERDTGKFHVREKHAYPDVWAAHASEDRMALRHDSWKATMLPDGSMKISARTLDTKLEMRLRGLKPPALLGKDGYLEVPPRSSHYYYSIPRMSAEGTISIDGDARKVEGLGWFKHEWGFMYSDHVKGWVWFGVQLSSGQELEIGLIFDRDWNLADGSFAVVEEKDGAVTPIVVREMEVKELGDTWRSPRTDTVYPTSWLLTIPGRGSLALRATVEGQEMVVFPANLWAGGLEVEGVFDGVPVTGDCFTEVVGLDEPFGRSLLRSGRPKKWEKVRGKRKGDAR
jgi:predicted secreted hydrolase